VSGMAPRDAGRDAIRADRPSASMAEMNERLPRAVRLAERSFLQTDALNLGPSPVPHA
jgi:hypothetical protein